MTNDKKLIQNSKEKRQKKYRFFISYFVTIGVLPCLISDIINVLMNKKSVMPVT
jgi:hypothetical protein